MHHSRAGMVHSFSDRFKTKNNSGLRGLDSMGASAYRDNKSVASSRSRKLYKDLPTGSYPEGTGVFILW
jgi:hypothetical protein